MKKPIRIIGTFLLAAVAFSAWYYIAANYDYQALSGTYVYWTNNESCVLRLYPNRTFVQEVSSKGQVQRAQGYWNRFGEAHVSFSGEFLKLPGQDFDASGQSHGEFEKILGLFPKLSLAPIPGGPRFHKRGIL
jgi:hypothetical protein